MDRNHEDISIACCLWGSWPRPSGSPVLGIDYVNRLYRAVERNITLPHRFFCFTDVPIDKYPKFEKGIFVRSIQTPSRMREIAKLYVYNPDNELTGRILVFDLDTVILSNIDDFVLRKEEFIVRKAFNPRYIDEFNGIGGDLISFDMGFGHFIWKKLKHDTAWMDTHIKGDERRAYKVLLKDTPITFWQDILPGRYISFKKHVVKEPDYKKRKTNIRNASLVSFHGKPRPHRLQNLPLIKQHWI
jgi:hypothetical protein